jgi:hypothetical protein
MFNVRIYLIDITHNIYINITIDTYIGLLRMLIYMYTDTLPVGHDAVLLEDIITADRYIPRLDIIVFTVCWLLCVDILIMCFLK